MPSDPSLSRRDAARVSAGAALFVGAFALAAFVPDRVHLPYLEPFVGLVALALLVAAALARSSRWVRLAYRRSVWIGFGFLVGWWASAVWAPPEIPLAVLLPLAWTLLATAENARAPSFPWALGIAAAPILAVSWLLLREQVVLYGSWYEVAVRLAWTSGAAGVILSEAFGVLLLLGVAPGIVAHLVGRWLHGADGWRPELRNPEDRTIALAAAAVLSALLGLKLLFR